MSESYWYYKLGEQQFGPITYDDLYAALHDGRLDPGTPVYGEEMPDWIPAWQTGRFELEQQGERPLLPGDPGYADDEEPPEEDPGPRGVLSADFTVPQVRPWVRVWAKVIDVGLWSLPAQFVFSLVVDAPTQLLLPFLPVYYTFTWCPVEAALLAYTGTTPGRSLLAIRLITSQGDTPTFAEALGRSLRVWVQGLGLGISLLAVFTGMFALMQLIRRSTTPWDARLGFKVVHDRIGPARAAVAAVVVAGVLFVGRMMSG